MKTTICLALGALCFTSGLASAQTFSNGDAYDGVQLKDIPDFGPLFRARPQTGEHRKFQLDKIPGIGPLFRTPAQQPDEKRAKGTKLSVLQTPNGERLQVEAFQQSAGDILRKVTSVMGVRAVIDAKLNENSYPSLLFQGRDWDSLLVSLAVALKVEMVKSPAGTYFFASKIPSDSPALFYQTPDGTLENADGLRLKLKDLLDGRINPDSTKPNREEPGFIPFLPLNPEPLQPQPDWQKREFNGRDYYFIPMPSLSR